MRFFTMMFFALVALLCPWPVLAGGGTTVIRDTEIEQAVKQWVTPIFDAAGLSPNQVHLVFVESSDVNAFVAGGANIFLYTGLFLKAQSADEIIGVIAHETGHIAGGHLFRSRQAAQKASFESMLAAVLGIGLGMATGNGNATGAIMGAGNSMATGSYLAHSRMQESSADQAGVRFMRRAGYSPEAMVTFMERLAESEALPDSFQQSYGRTHPGMADRADSIKAALSGDEASTPPSARFQESFNRIKAKLVAFTAPDQVAWQYDATDDSFPSVYARSIAAYRKKDMPTALKLVGELIKREPNNPYLYELQGQIYLDDNDVDRSIASLRRAVDNAPSAPLLQIMLAEAMIAKARLSSGDKAGLLQQAANLLNKAVVKEENDGGIYRDLAIISGMQGKTAEAQAFLAEEALLQGRYGEARSLANRATKELGSRGRAGQLARDVLSYLDANPNLVKDAN